MGDINWRQFQFHWMLPLKRRPSAPVGIDAFVEWDS